MWNWGAYRIGHVCVLCECELTEAVLLVNNWKCNFVLFNITSFYRKRSNQSLRSYSSFGRQNHRRDLCIHTSKHRWESSVVVVVDSGYHKSPRFNMHLIIAIRGHKDLWASGAHCFVLARVPPSGRAIDCGRGFSVKFPCICDWENNEATLYCDSVCVWVIMHCAIACDLWWQSSGASWRVARLVSHEWSHIAHISEWKIDSHLLRTLCDKDYARETHIGSPRRSAGVDNLWKKLKCVCVVAVYVCYECLCAVLVFMF